MQCKCNYASVFAQKQGSPVGEFSLERKHKNIGNRQLAGYPFPIFFICFYCHDHEMTCKMKREGADGDILELSRWSN